MLRKKTSQAFTLVEVAMAVALVAIGIVVAGLAYRGYSQWAVEHASRENAQNLVNAVIHARAQGVSIAGNGHTFPLAVTVTRANEIYGQIDGPIATAGGVVQILPEGYTVIHEDVFPSGWMETSPGIFAPIP